MVSEIYLQMRKVILTAISILAMVIMVSISTASAESGMLIEFPERVSEVNAVIFAKIENL